VWSLGGLVGNVVVLVVVVVLIVVVVLLCRGGRLLRLNISCLMCGVIWVDEGVGSTTISASWDTVNLLGVRVSRGVIGSIGIVLEVRVGWVVRVDEWVPVRVGSLSWLNIVVVLVVVIVLLVVVVVVAVLVVSRGSLLNRSWLTVVRIMRSRVLSVGSSRNVSSFQDLETINAS